LEKEKLEKRVNKLKDSA
jgi:hypothetical protein